MIKLISRKKIEEEKYNNCLQQAINYRIYAEIWYLDALTNRQWDCYVLNDYEAIMPVPYQQFLGIKIIVQPIYCQQLGVFHQENFSEEIFKEFEGELRFRLVRGYNFNEENLIFQKNSKYTKINQILDLTDYESFYNQLRKDRKQDIKKGLSEDFKIVASDIDQHFIALLENEYKDIKAQLYIHKLKPLVEILQRKKMSKTISVFKNNEVLASSFYIKSGNRMIQLCNAKKASNSLNFSTYIVDYLVKNNQHQNLILDFEGSSLKGIHEFNKSFRAESKLYSLYKSKFL